MKRLLCSRTLSGRTGFRHTRLSPARVLWLAAALLLSVLAVAVGDASAA